jgi:hypothetical protein
VNGVVECGSADRLASGGVAKGLQNGVYYAVAASSYDAVYNSGPLSNVTCEAPQLVTDFFELYRADGGKAGGGFCAFSPRSRMNDPAPALLSITVLMGLFFARRTRASN